MIRIFLGKGVEDIAIAPFELKQKGGAVLEPCKTGFPMNPAGKIIVLPSISAFVGPDAVAMLIACRPWTMPGWSLLLDIGTNCEIALVHGDRILVCAAAAGPAFEGGSIENGMAASPGAITSVSLKEGAILPGTIGDAPPEGICGSGLISATSAMLDAGLIDATGRMLADESRSGAYGRRFKRDQAGRLRFFLTEGVAITQNDIRELQLAKAAIAAGIRILCADAGITPARIERVFLAGAFGSSLDAAALLNLGVIPGSPEIVSMGNAAATGAAACLISREALAMADRIARKAESVNLAAREEFNDIWIESMDFGPLNEQQS